MSLSVFADDVTISVSAPSTVEVGDKFRVQFRVNSQNVSGFSAPDFKGFEVIYGPSTSSQSSFQIVNGHTTQSSSITYTYVILSSAAGSFTINPASVQVEGKTVKSKPFTIKVLPVGQGGGQQSQSSGQSQRGSSSAYGGGRPSASSSSGSIGSKDLFMTATASRTNIYEQEAILLTYKIYSLVNLTQLDGKLPTLDGFQIQEIPLPRNKEFQLEQYNGRNYRTVVWSQYVLFPQKSGDLVIPAINYEGVVVTQNRNIDPIEAFFNGASGMMEMKKTITTPKLTIHVKPLPQKPAGFSSAVGKFDISSSINGTDVMTNDALTLKLSVKGTGNMKLIGTPEIEWPKDFETYDPKVTDNFSLTRNGLTGTKEYEYLAVPRHAGTYTIPAAKFIYFDPSSSTYKTVTTQPYTINVKKGKGGDGTSVSNYSSNQQDVRELGQDIRYIKQGDTRLVQKNSRFFATWKYALGYLVPIIVFFIIAIVGHKRIQANANVALSRGKKANKKAIKRLKTASKLLADKKQNEFYDEVLRALWGYIADKLNMPQESLNKDNINAELMGKSVPQEVIDGFIKALNDCEFARYAPSTDTDAQMEGVYETAIDIIGKIEEVL